MKGSFICIALVCACSVVCSGQISQIPYMKDAPFSAEEHVSSTPGGGEWITQIARSSMGSIYESRQAPAGIDSTWISINDAATNCNTHISPFISHMSQRSNGAWTGGQSILSIQLSGGSSDNRRLHTVEGIRQGNRRMQQSYIDNGGTVTTHAPYGDVQLSSLGERNVNGSILFGFHVVTAPDATRHENAERWESDLGFTYSMNWINPQDGSSHSQQITNLKLTEPDPALFMLQEKYFPPTDVFSNARTIYVSAPDISADLQHKIEAALTGSGRLTLAPDVKTADMIVRANMQAPPSSAPTTKYSQVHLEIRVPGSGQRDVMQGDILMHIGLTFTGPAEGWPGSPVVNTCLASSWERIESLHLTSASANSTTPPVPIPRP